MIFLYSYIGINLLAGLCLFLYLIGTEKGRKDVGIHDVDAIKGYLQDPWSNEDTKQWFSTIFREVKTDNNRYAAIAALIFTPGVCFTGICVYLVQMRYYKKNPELFI